MSHADLRVAKATRRMLAFAVLAAALVTLVGRDAAAAGPVTRTWTGAGANSNWTNHANWNPGAPAPGDRLIFPVVAARKTNTNDYPDGTAFKDILFQGSGYTLNGNHVSLSAGLTSFVEVGAGNTVNLEIWGEGGVNCMAGTIEFMAANKYHGTTSVTGGVVHAGHATAFGQFNAIVDVMAGAVSLADGVTVHNPLVIGGPTAPVLTTEGSSEWRAPITIAGPTTLNAGPGATLSLTRPISGPSLILKTGPGAVVLSGENIFSGNLKVSEGVLAVTRPEALGSPLGSTIVDGGTLEFDEALVAEPIIISGAGHDGLGALRNIAGINDMGNLLVDEDATINVAMGVLRLTNGIQEAGENLEVTQIGGGTLEVEGEGDFGGKITVREGWLSVRGDLLAAVDIDGGDLFGDGSTGPVRLLSGWLTPGIQETGVLTVEGDFAAGPEGSVHFTIDAGDSHTALRVTGLVSLDSPSLWIDGQGDVPPGGAVTLIQNTGPAPIDGEFAFREEGSDLIVGDSTFFLITYAGGPEPANDVVLSPLPPDSADASLHLMSTPQGAPSGGKVPLLFRASNAGPDSATSPEVTITVGAGLAFVSLTAPAGWGCQTPVVGAPGEITCTRAMLPAGVVEEFAVVFSVTAAAGAVVHFSATIEHESDDPDDSNNAIDAAVAVSAPGQMPYRRALPGLAGDGL